MTSDIASTILAAASVCGACFFAYWSGRCSGYLQGAADRDREHQQKRVDKIYEWEERQLRALEERNEEARNKTQNNADVATAVDLKYPNIG